MRLFPLCLVVTLLLPCRPAHAGEKSVTLYLDGARVELEAAAPGGYLEFPLPDTLSPGTFRVKPLGAGSVVRVELVPAERDRRRLRDLARLEERKCELEDRMQALSRREEIFSAALKSQSGKAPRRSKSNPDPVGSLQQGTDFALFQLESVYRSKRKCQRALDALELELAAAKKGSALARIWLSGVKARLSYETSGERWTPSYDLRWSGDAKGELSLHAGLPPAERGVRYLVSPGTLAQGLTAQAVRGDYPTIARYPLTLTSVGRGGEAPASFAFTPIREPLPPAEASLFWRGEYLGSGRFAGTGAAEFAIGR